MRIAPEGLPFLIVGFGVTLALAAWSLSTPAVTPVVWVAVVLTLFVGYFFRDPRRVGGTDLEQVLSAADGRVVIVDEVDEPTFMKGRCRRIAIFLSIFNVHVQRSPITGTVRHRDYVAGTFAAAWADKASDDNERATLGIEASGSRIVVRQIAGLVARRIVTDPKDGDHVVRGQRIGLIRFGSRVEIFLPLEWHIEVEVGDRVQAGRTPVARIQAAR